MWVVQKSGGAKAPLAPPVPTPMYCLRSSPTKKCENDGQYLNVDCVKFYSNYYT